MNLGEIQGVNSELGLWKGVVWKGDWVDLHEVTTLEKLNTPMEGRHGMAMS